MVLPAGTITMAQVNAEIGASPTANVTLNNTSVRYLAATSPTSPIITAGTTISMNNLRGKKARIFATGGTLVPTPTHNIHVFTSPGTFTVNITYPAANTVEYLVVAGGGGGGSPSGGSSPQGGGGGAGGFRSGSGFPVVATSYPITIGGGGSANGSGNPSTFSTITSLPNTGGILLHLFLRHPIHLHYNISQLVQRHLLYTQLPYQIQIQML